MRFFVGLHIPFHAHQVDRCMISVNRLRDRRSPVPSSEWMMDSGSFTEVARRGPYAWTGGAIDRYADEIARWYELSKGSLVCAVAPDLMCEAEMIAKVHMGTARTHIGVTVHNYMRCLERLRSHFGGESPVHLLPVLQGYAPADYVHCLEQYGNNITPREYTGPSSGWTFGLPGEGVLARGMWVGVGSVCKRNADPSSVVDVLRAIKSVRPDLRLHGFGLKLTALKDDRVRELLYSADSMAWSYHARKNGRSGNDVREAVKYVDRVEKGPVQTSLFSIL